jgi:hypothetical protein
MGSLDLAQGEKLDSGTVTVNGQLENLNFSVGTKDGSGVSALFPSYLLDSQRFIK